jgi:hypothetical protein
MNGHYTVLPCFRRSGKKIRIFLTALVTYFSRGLKQKILNFCRFVWDKINLANNFSKKFRYNKTCFAM